MSVPSSEQDTIAAISTPPGLSGIAIVRLSGPRAFAIADRLFHGRCPSPPSQWPSHVLHYGHICEGDTVLDEVLLTVMRAPRTYTREDIVELNCHGGPAVVREILQLVLREGARLAEPGEFTRRAFLNGRLDLAQAEAVGQLVEALTSEAARVALGSLRGHLSKRVGDWRRRVLDVLVVIEAGLDFPEEDLELSERESLIGQLTEVAGEMTKLLSKAEYGELLFRGVRVAIAGKPNVGKSTLLNTLVRKERALVAPLPGTTRDTVEEGIDLEGIPVRLVDTGGLGRTDDPLAELVRERSIEAIRSSDLVIFVLDRSQPLDDEDREVARLLDDLRVLVVLSKSDLPQQISIEPVGDILYGRPILEVSGKTGKGVEALEAAIMDIFGGTGGVASEEALVTNLRQREGISKARERLIQGIGAAQHCTPGELVAVDLRDAIQALDEVVGADVTGDVLSPIFERFCIGK